MGSKRKAVEVEDRDDCEDGNAVSRTQTVSTETTQLTEAIESKHVEIIPVPSSESAEPCEQFAHHTSGASADQQPRAAKRLKLALHDVAKATAYAALGSVATIGFLASPLAQRLAGL